MSEERWRHIEELFHRGADLAPEERQEFLNSACAGDPELRGELESLLAADGETGAVLEAAVAQAAVQFHTETGEAAELAGQHIGPYLITGLVGRGGMGAVYRAVREGEFRMEVAIKLLKRGTDTDAALSRFRKERQILAALQHPNIARLLDGGATADGLPYFVMEYVQGRPFLEYAARVSIRQRLELFRRVCAAVQYAHQNLIVHRDLKPGNILVTADGTPKLLDFGIAKLLDQELAPSDMTLTLASARLMTPDYASPEQIRGEPVTTASDIYSLGVVLYELLTEKRPYRVETGAPEAIVESRQSTTRPSAWNRQLDPDLDNIVLMALRPEPERRYASAEQLSDDILRYLEGRPVRARQDTFGYRASKFVRRNRLAVIAAGVVLIALLVGVAAVQQQARRAEYRFQQVRKLASTVLFDLDPKIEPLAGSTAARELLVSTSLEYLDSLEREAGDDPALQLELATAYERIGDVQGNSRMANLGHPAAALESYRKGMAIAGKLKPSLAALELQARLYYKTGSVQYWGMGHSSEAQGNLRQAIRIADSIPARTGDPAYQVRVEAHAFLGDMGEILAPDGALEPLRRSVEISEQWVAAEPGSQSRYYLETSLERWGTALALNGDPAAARDALLRALAIIEQLVKEDAKNSEWKRERAVVWERLGMVSGHPRYINLGDPKAAVQWFQRLLGDLESLAAADPSNLRARFDLSEADADLGAAYAEIDPGRAEQLYRRSLALSASFLESNPGDWEALFYQAFNRLEFASVLHRLGKPAQSLAQLQKCIQILEDLARSDPLHPGGRQLLGVALNMRAAQLLQLGDAAGGERDQQRSLAILEKLYRENPRSLTLLRDLADSYKGAGDMAASQSDWKQARIGYQKSLDLWEHWGNVGTSTIYYRTQREAAARLVARAARRAGKNSSPQ